MWVIKVHQNYGATSSWLLYTGKTYINQGECFGSFTSMTNQHEAKKYSSKKRALNALKSLENKVWNFEKGEVIQLPNT